MGHLILLRVGKLDRDHTVTETSITVKCIKCKLIFIHDASDVTVEAGC